MPCYPLKKLISLYILKITVGLYVFYIFNTHIKFCSNRILFTI